MRARGLTDGEAAIVARVFGETIDVSYCQIKQQRWWPLQPRGIVMAPDGHLYFAPDAPGYLDDFASGSIPTQAFFLHEMTHVWQHQCGTNLVLARGLFARYQYLPLLPGKPFELYGIEQQAEIVRHYWLLCHDIAVEGAPPRAAYEKLLPFLPLASSTLLV